MTENYSRGIADTFKNINKLFPSFGAGFNIDIIILLRNGLYKEPADVTSDLSEFLKQAEKALDELPYVYQRLFRSETLQNEALFIGRTNALNTLENAYNAFQKSQYAATVIIGERGSGKTSLMTRVALLSS